MRVLPFSAGILAILLAIPSSVLAVDAPATGGTGERKALSLPGGEGNKTLELTAGAGSVFGKEELLLKDYVDIHYGDLRLQADSVRYLPSTKECFAEGNVIVDNGPTRITARKVEYNLEAGTGTFTRPGGTPSRPSISRRKRSRSWERIAT